MSFSTPCPTAASIAIWSAIHAPPWCSADPTRKPCSSRASPAPLAVGGDADAQLREVYYAAWPDGRERLTWPTISYWCIRPRWARYSDYGAGPLIQTFDWAET